MRRPSPPTIEPPNAPGRATRHADVPSDGTLIGLGVLGFGGVGIAALVMAGAGAVGWPCPWLLITGFNCPFCGATRMLMALYSGELGEALRFNAPVLFIGAAVAALWFVWVAQRLGYVSALRVLPNARQRRLLLVGIGVVGAAFTVLRNLPWEPFSALAV